VYVPGNIRGAGLVIAVVGEAGSFSTSAAARRT